MGLAKDGRSIYCDGTGCSATAPFPVALRPVLAPDAARNEATARGWLCVLSEDSGLYYCPACAARYLETLGKGIFPAIDIERAEPASPCTCCP